jgi:hypothetical protein
MRGAFPAAEVVGYADLLQALPIDPKDRHVLAAAIVSGAAHIVTNNLRHFPSDILAQYQVVAITPDTFLNLLFAREPDRLCANLRQQAAALQRPAYTLAELLDRLGHALPQFIEAVRQHLD